MEQKKRSYEELATALRYCLADDGGEDGYCERCPLAGERDLCVDVMLRESAEAIEEMLEERDAWRRLHNSAAEVAQKLMQEKEACTGSPA